VTKPFSIQELLARVRAHLRRAPERSVAVIEAGDFVIDPEAHTAELCGKPLRLTPTEFQLLLYLARQAGKAVTHHALLKAVWGPQSTQQNEYLRVFIGQVRRKLDAESDKQYIQTEPWIGYRFLPDGFTASSGEDEIP
jgi:two-component system, OmpR family, KDP operon response regulator KdpE